jgi:hypothetical protein
MAEKLGKFIKEKMNEVSEALPLIGAGHSMEADMIFGWRPENIVISGAPIPLLYNYEPINIPCNPATGKELVPMYYGPRPANSLEVHRAFSNKAQNSDCPDSFRVSKKDKENIPDVPPSGQSYIFKFPVRHQLLKR